MNHLDQFLHLTIDKLSGFLTIWLIKVISTRAGRIIIRHIADLIAHTVISHHSICHLGQTLEIVESSSRRLAIDNFLSNAASDKRTHFIIHMVTGHKLTFLREIPCSTKCMTARYDCNLEERVCVWQQPAYCCMSCLMICNRLLLLRSYNLGLLLLEQDEMGRVACETVVTTGMIMCMGEITTTADIDIPKIAREVVKDIGYDRAKYGFDSHTCAVLTSIDEQSPDIAMGVNEAYEYREENNESDVRLAFS